MICRMKSEIQILKFCFEKGKRVYFPPKISDIIIKSSDEMNLVDTPLYICKNTDISLAQRFLKRIMDIVISLTGIIITSPIMLITAIAIYAYDRGPVLYKQVRCTKGNREFKICKFPQHGRECRKRWKSATCQRK